MPQLSNLHPEPCCFHADCDPHLRGLYRRTPGFWYQFPSGLGCGLVKPGLVHTVGVSAKLWITGCLCCVESDVAAHWETGIQHSRLPGGLCSVFHAARQGSGLLEQVQVVIQAALILTYFYPNVWMTEVGIPFKNITWLSSLVAIARSIPHCGAASPTSCAATNGNPC